MPIFDEILSQPAILISVVVAVLFIVAAMVLAVLPRMKANRARSKRRKAQNALRQENMQLSAEEDGDEVAPAVGRSARQAASSSAAAPVATPTPTPAAKPQMPATPSAPVVTASALNAALSGGTTETKKDEVTPEMQSLLSSVFSDEENSERQAILLKGIEPVSIDELLTLSKAVSSQLRGEQPTNIVRVKENELV